MVRRGAGTGTCWLLACSCVANKRWLGEPCAAYRIAGSMTGAECDVACVVRVAGFLSRSTGTKGGPGGAGWAAGNRAPVAPSLWLDSGMR